jgi:hypothetical protein
MSIVGAAYGYISLATTGDDTEYVGLNETVLAVRRKAKHDFAKGDDLSHCLKMNYWLLIMCIKN